MGRRYRVVNYFGSRNHGDELMLRGLLALILDFDPDATFTVTTLGPLDREQRLFPRMDFLTTLMTLSGSRSRFLRTADALLTLCQAKWMNINRHRMRQQTGRTKDAYIHDLIKADLIVTAGGPFLADSPPLRLFQLEFPRAHRLIFALAELFVATWCDKPLIVAGQTIGPIASPLSSMALKYVLRRARSVAVREPISQQQLQRIDPALGTRSQVVPDLAFAPWFYGHPQDQRTAKLVPPPREYLQVAVSVRSLGPASIAYLSGVTGLAPPGIPALYAELWKGMLLAMSHAERCLFRFVCQEADDEYISRQLAGQISPVAEVELVPYEAGSKEFLYTFARSDFALVTRYHGAVMAIRSGIPFLAFDYSRKARGLLTLAGLDHLLIEPEALNNHCPTGKIEEALSNRLQWQEEVKRAGSQLQNQLVAWALATFGESAC